MRKRVWVATVLAALIGAAPAYAADDSVWEAGLTPAGDAILTVGPSVYRDPEFERIEVFRCPGGACEAEPLPHVATGGTRFPSRGGQWLSVDVSVAGAGDVFEARFLDAGGQVVKTERTAAWQGVAALDRAPSVQGDPVVGASVTPVAGHWSGGWATPWSSGGTEELVACRTAAGTDCAWLSYGLPLALEARWRGWFLFSVSRFWSGRTNWVSGQVLPAYGSPTGDVTRTTLLAGSGPVGPIAAAPQTAPTVGPAATASIRARALRRDHRLSVARVTCPVRCSVVLTVRGGGKTVRRSIQVVGSSALTIAPRHGRLQVKVVVDGKTLASGVSRAR
jgi:hypothetical protein